MSLFSFGKTQFDFISIGDVVVDAFIKLKDAHIDCDKEKGTCDLCMTYADKLPYESVEVLAAVGNSANAAVSSARLGLKTGFITNMGKDSDGDRCIDVFENEGISTMYMTRHDDVKTNYHYVLWFENDRTILAKHEAYDYKLPEFAPPKWIYLSSLGASTEKYHDEIADYLEKNPEVKLAFQPGTFQMKLGTEKLTRIYNRTDIFFCNVEESQRILGTTETDLKKLLSGIRALGPKIAVITDGPKGSYADDGTRQFFLDIYPQEPAVERTGAGDAFASTTTIATIKGLALDEAMKWGSINSMSVCKFVGAQKGLLHEGEIKDYLAKAPADWNIKLI